jgi:hypothetical protein
MGKSKEMKKYINISGFNIRQPNRGNAALSYGAIGFLRKKGLITEGQELIHYQPYVNIFRKRNRGIKREIFIIDGQKVVYNNVPVFALENYIIKKYGIILPFTNFGRTIKKVAYEAADYGGDGFSDIYGDYDFQSRMSQTFLLWKAEVPLIMLPQTIGPFKKKENYDLAVKIMRYAKEIYVRDDKFADNLEKLGLKYTQTKDISSYMQPEPWDIKIEDNSIGVNVSGLAYSNTFHGLEGQFDTYPDLIERIINHFRRKGCTIYLIPHSYSYCSPDDNDDMVACRLAFERLSDKNKVILIDKDMSAPQIKYVISRMKFFIGARMHANFAAIYTGVPVFGTAYSYKFQGAFDANGLDGKAQTAMINNLEERDIDSYILKIEAFYNKVVKM